MFRARDGSGEFRRIARGVATALLLAAPLALGGCGVLGDLFGGRETTPRIVVVGTPAPVIPTPTPEQQVAAERATSVAIFEGTVTQEEAESVVSAWFEALDAEDYLAAEELTGGNARGHTRQLADSIQREGGEQGVQIDLVVRRLELSPGPPAKEFQTVDADFDIDVNARLGAISVTAREVQGSATFVVERVQGDPKITDILNVEGLPTS